MAKFYNLAYFFTIISMGWSSALGEEIKEGVAFKREPRHLLQSKLCHKLGLCGHQGYNGYQGGYNQGGYNQGGYNQGGYYPYPPINIGISQSQSSSSTGGGGYGSTSYPNNYQYNGGYPHYGGHKRPGYFGNGFGSYNNQFNGNYYGGQRGYEGQGGYGFQSPYGYKEESSGEDYDDYSRSAKSDD